MKNCRYSILAVSISLCCASGTASAGGFGITVQSASDGGTAATGHAMADDASAMWYNPALLSSVEGTQLNGGVSLVNPDLKVTNTGSTAPLAAAGFPVVGNNVGEPAGLGGTPSMFYKRNIGINKAFGLGVNIPFGASTEYEKDSFARYEARESSLSAVNINPAISWKINDKLALGAGLNVQYGQAVLAKSIDAGLACRSVVAAGAAQQGADATTASAAATGTCTNIGLADFNNTTTDSQVSVEVSGFAFGANIGAAYKPSPSTTISVGYRSSVNYELEGEADFTHTGLANLGNATLTAAGLADQDATADIKLPASASLAFSTKVNSKLTLHGDVTWTQWSTVPEIRIVFPDTVAADSVTSLEWEDTVRVGVGMTYQMTPKTKLRTGIALDPTPTPDPEHRTPRSPSSDALWFSVGMSHQMNKKLSFDASLAYVKPEDTTINYTSPGATASDDTGYFSRGDVEANAISAALSVNYRFK